MDPEIDWQISEHAARMHRYCTDDGGSFAVLQSNIFVFNSSILFICLIKDNLINCRIKRDMPKKMTVMLMQPFFVEYCSVVRIEEARKPSKTG
jgi:hypothetical protein